MATKRPIGPAMRGRTPGDEERIRSQFDKLSSLVPRDLAEKLMSGVLDEIDKEFETDNTVLLPKSILKKIEAEEIPKSLKSQFKRFIKKFVGKPVKDLPMKLSAKEKRQQLTEEADQFVKMLVSGWLQTMWILSMIRR